MIRFEIDESDIKRVADEFKATEKQVGQAISRALSRTAATMRKRSQTALTKGLDLRRASALRKRLKALKLRRKGGIREISIWFGLNDMLVDTFRGSPKETGSGASFRGTGYPGGFVARGKRGGSTIFRRKGRERLPIVEQTVPIEDEAMRILEDEVFHDIAEVFGRHFVSDLRARVNFGNDSWDRRR